MMDFLKKHYEKVLLSAVLVGLLVAAALLPIKVSADKATIRQQVEQINARTTKRPFKAPDLSSNLGILHQLQNPPKLVLSGQHNLFNPVKWEKKADGTLIKIQTGNEVGPGAVVITKITAMHTIIAFDHASGNPPDVQYHFKVTREAEQNPSLRGPLTRIVSMDSPQSDVFQLKKVVGSPADPKDLVLELLDSNQTIHVGPNKPYSAIAGYTADLRYPPESLTFRNRRVGDRLHFAGDVYKIVAITDDEVRLEAASTGKRTTVAYAKAAQN